MMAAATAESLKRVGERVSMSSFDTDIVSMMRVFRCRDCFPPLSQRGQKAMRLALLYPEPEKGGRGKKSTAVKSVETTGFSRSRLDQARAVLRHSRELAEAVRDGTVGR